MTPGVSDWEPCSRAVTLSADRARGILERLRLGGDPWDPRQGLALGSHGFLDWLEAEPEEPTLADSEGQQSVQADWPAVLCRHSWALALDYHGHSLGLVVVARTENATTPAVYELTADCVMPELEAVCCVYVEAEADGSVSVLLNGWVESRSLTRAPGALDKPIRITQDQLQPMHLLRERLRQRAGPAPLVRPSATSAAPRPKRPVRLFAALGMATAAAVLFAMLWWLTPPRIVEREVPGPPRFAQALLDWQLTTEPLRGTAGSPLVVVNGQTYNLNIRTASSFRKGWVFQADARAVFLLALLQKQPDSTLAASCHDDFDKQPGWEYFITVLANQAVPELGEKPTSKVEWLTPADLAELQVLAGKAEEHAALERIRQALDRTALKGTDYAVRLQRVEHRE